MYSNHAKFPMCNGCNLKRACHPGSHCGAIILLPYPGVNSLQLILISGTPKWNLRVPHIQMRVRDLTRQGTWIVVSAMATRWLAQGPDHFENKHRVWQLHHHTLYKISNRSDKWCCCHRWMKFFKIWVLDCFRTEPQHCNDSEGCWGCTQYRNRSSHLGSHIRTIIPVPYHTLQPFCTSGTNEYNSLVPGACFMTSTLFYQYENSRCNHKMLIR